MDSNPLPTGEQVAGDVDLAQRLQAHMMLAILGRGITQGDLARMLGTDQAAIARATTFAEKRNARPGDRPLYSPAKQGLLLMRYGLVIAPDLILPLMLKLLEGTGFTLAPVADYAADAGGNLLEAAATLETDAAGVLGTLLRCLADGELDIQERATVLQLIKLLRRALDRLEADLRIQSGSTTTGTREKCSTSRRGRSGTSGGGGNSRS